MESKSKKRLYLIGAIVVAVMFVTSYAAFGNNNVGTGISSTTVASCGGYFVTGTVNSVIIGYGSSVAVTSTNQSTIFISNLTSRLGDLQANGSISEYRLYDNGTFGVYLASINAYALQILLKNISSQLHVNGTEDVALPHTVLLYYSGNPIHIVLPIQNFTITTNALSQLNSSATLKVYALVNKTGIVCNKQVSVTPA